MSEFTFNTNVNVRAGPSTHTRRVEQYHPGESVNIDRTHYAEGKMWGSYMGGSGQRRYVCLNDRGESYGNFN